MDMRGAETALLQTYAGVDIIVDDMIEGNIGFSRL